MGQKSSGNQLTGNYDAIVIGGGHNGLTTAAYLQKAGINTLVLERRHIVGGACVTEEVFPGYKVSTTSYVCSLLRPEIIRDLELKKYGYEILERNQGSSQIILVGIRTRGVFLAERLQKQIQAIEKKEIPLGMLDITLYRDDLGEIGALPEIRETKLPGDISGKIVILVDDVLYTGRTIRAALDALIDFGRPRAIQLAVLVDRGHRELPIKADYIGKNIPTSKEEEVILRLAEKDGKDEAVVAERKKV